MRNYQTPSTPIHLLATVLFFVGLALTIAVHKTPWIGIPIMVVGLLISITLLLVQRGNRQR